MFHIPLEKAYFLKNERILGTGEARWSYVVYLGELQLKVTFHFWGKS